MIAPSDVWTGNCKITLKLKAIRACLGPYGKTGNIIIAVRARAHNDNFHTRVSSFIGQHFGKKIGLLPTAGAENHAFGGFHTPPTNALKV